MNAESRSAIHRHVVVIPKAAIDANGHANNVEYLRWMQAAAISHADTSGCTAATAAVGASWVVRSHLVEYLGPDMGFDLQKGQFVEKVRPGS